MDLGVRMPILKVVENDRSRHKPTAPRGGSTQTDWFVRIPRSARRSWTGFVFATVALSVSSKIVNAKRRLSGKARRPFLHPVMFHGW